MKILKIGILCIVFNIYFNSLLTLDFSNFVDNPKVIIFEIEKTLIEMNNFSAARNYFGLFNITLASMSTDLESYYLEILEKIPSPAKESCKKHTVLPKIQKDSLIGKVSAADCISKINGWIENNSHVFETDNKKNIFKKMANLHFNPQIYFKYQSYTKYIKLLKKIFEVTDKKSKKRKNIIIIISNQMIEHVSQLKKEFTDIFK